MTHRVVLTLALICLLLTGSVSVVVGAGDRAGHTVNHDTVTPVAVEPGPVLTAQQSSVPGLQEPPDADATVTQITVQPNGTAVWSLTIRMELDSDQAEAEFAAFQEEFASNRSEFINDYRTTMVSAVSEAENLTQREMTATGFEAETGTEAVPREWGFVTYRFRWEGLAVVDNGSLSIGDAFEDGLFLEENGILVIRSPDGYESTAVEPDPDQVGSNELRWGGPVQFADGRPFAEFVQSGSADDSVNGADTTDGSTDTADDSGGDDSGGALPGSVLFGTAGVAVLAGVAALYLHRRRQEPDPAESSADHGATDDGQEPDTAAEPAETRQSKTDSGEMPELATDADRVIATLEGKGGRMRQSDLADQLDWSPSKTSRVLSDMADEGEIEKLRIGRENVIDLAGAKNSES